MGERYPRYGEQIGRRWVSLNDGVNARGGHSGTEGGRTLVTYFAEEGVIF